MLKLPGLVVVAAALTASVAFADVNWDSLPYTPISTYEAVNPNGSSAYSASGFPIRMIGVVLNNTEDWLDPTPAFDSGFTPWYMGGQSELIVQAVNPGDFGGVFCWMGQNYGNHPYQGGGDPINSYSDAEWTAELKRLGLYGGDGVAEPIRAGTLVEIRARIGLHYNGKMNVNEAHQKSPTKDFEIIILDRNYGLPTPTALTLDLVKDPGNVAIFDPDRATGGEHYQATLVDLKNVKVISGTWAVDQTVTVQDRSGRTLDMYMGLNSGFASTQAPPSYFNAEGIVDQSSSSGKDGYRLLALDPSGVIRHGDVDKDYTVSFADFGVVVGNYSGTGGTGKTWAQGNFNEVENGSVDFDDFSATIANFTGNTAYGPSREELRPLGSGDDQTMLTGCDGELQLVVDIVTGQIKLVGDGAQVNSWDIYSLSGSLIADPAGHPGASPWLGYLINTEHEVAAFGLPLTYQTVDGELELGMAFKVGGTMDLQFQYLDAAGTLINGNVVAVPEPATLALLMMGGLAVIRRRKSTGRSRPCDDY